MNRNQWRAVFAGVLMEAVVAATVPISRVIIPPSGTYSNSPDGTIYYTSSSLTMKTRECALTCVFLATAGMVFALRERTAGKPDA